MAIWSTGFVVARALGGAVDPNIFLATRFSLAAALLLPVALAARAPWPRGAALARHVGAGVLVQGLYLGLAYRAVADGLPASVMALLGALQPLLVALLARAWLGEAVAPRIWAGLLTGLAGVALVLAPRVATLGAGVDVAIGVLAVASLSLGTLLQKTSLADTDLRTASVVQTLGAAATAVLLAVSFGERHWAPGPAQWAALAWATLVVSGGGTTLLIWLVRSGGATRASALLLAVPPLVAVETWALFGEALSGLQWAGLAVALGGVWLARR